jgi:hypothetical protein
MVLVILFLLDIINSLPDVMWEGGASAAMFIRHCVETCNNCHNEVTTWH